MESLHSKPFTSTAAAPAVLMLAIGVCHGEAGVKADCSAAVTLTGTTVVAPVSHAQYEQTNGAPGKFCPTRGMRRTSRNGSRAEVVVAGSTRP